ncbi:MAG: conjugal transfer protein TraF [Thiohalospira sp.]
MRWRGPRRRTLALLPGLLLPLAAPASPGLTPLGTAVGGTGTTLHDAGATRSNPSASAALTTVSDNAAGLLGLTAGYRLGPLDDLEDRVDYLDAQLKRDDLTAAEAGDLKDDLDALLNRLERDGYARGHGAIQWPGTPFLFESEPLGGTIEVTAETLSRVAADVLAEPVRVETDGAGDPYLDTDAAATFRYAEVTSLGLGYSRELSRQPEGALYGGVRYRHHSVHLAREAVVYDRDADDPFDTPDDPAYIGSDGASIDLGLTWAADHYTLQAGLLHLGSPSFDWEEQSATVDGYPESPRWTLEPRFTYAASVHTADRRWYAGARVDLGERDDVFGEPTQWFAADAGFAPGVFWFPDVRFGVRGDRASGTTLYTGGITLFRRLHLDLARSLDTVEVDGEDRPRAASAALTLEHRFD